MIRVKFLLHQCYNKKYVTFGFVYFDNLSKLTQSINKATGNIRVTFH